MVRTYWLVPGFNEASGNLDLQPFARIDQIEACRPRAMWHRLYGVRVAMPLERETNKRAYLVLRAVSGARN
jgi:hypothetical protein